MKRSVPDAFTTASSGVCVFYIDTCGLMAYVNDYCCRDLGYAREELIARSVTDTDMLPEDAQRFACMLAECLCGKEKRFEATVQRKDGSKFPAKINMERAPYGNRILLRCDLAEVAPG